MIAHDLGIQGYLLKKAGKEELHSAILQIMNGENYYYNDVVLTHS
jgi:DNA-binding NarL/FixJ family response regulator